jgi:hypothetical protein
MVTLRITRQATPRARYASWKKRIAEQGPAIKWAELHRDAENLKGKLVMFGGQVHRIEAAEGRGRILLRCAVRWWSHKRVSLNYSYSQAKNPLDREVMMIFIGRVRGRHEFRNEAGVQVSLPEIDVEDFVFFHWNGSGDWWVGQQIDMLGNWWGKYGDP